VSWHARRFAIQDANVSAKLLQIVVDEAHSQDIRVIAEGIENEEYL
jgi:EAL domain-containing protein (putative c-di-GMP-specific phosphodiesterase class I)